MLPIRVDASCAKNYNAAMKRLVKKIYYTNRTNLSNEHGRHENDKKNFSPVNIWYFRSW
jgi:hypothetical protein